MDLTFDISHLPSSMRERIVRQVRHEDEVAYVLGLIEQRQLKNLMDQAAVPGMNTELGPQNMILSGDQWRRAMRKFGQLCFADPEFGPWLLKKNEDFRVKDVGTRMQSGYTGNGDSRRSSLRRRDG